MLVRKVNQTGTTLRSTCTAFIQRIQSALVRLQLRLSCTSCGWIRLRFYFKTLNDYVFLLTPVPGIMFESFVSVHSIDTCSKSFVTASISFSTSYSQKRKKKETKQRHRHHGKIQITSVQCQNSDQYKGTSLVSQM